MVCTLPLKPELRKALSCKLKVGWTTMERSAFLRDKTVSLKGCKTPASRSPSENTLWNFSKNIFAHAN